jgi:hypothetical protein
MGSDRDCAQARRGRRCLAGPHGSADSAAVPGPACAGQMGSDRDCAHARSAAPGPSIATRALTPFLRHVRSAVRCAAAGGVRRGLMVPRFSLPRRTSRRLRGLAARSATHFAPQAALRSIKRTEHETRAARPLAAGAAQIGPAGHRLPRRRRRRGHAVAGDHERRPCFSQGTPLLSTPHPEVSQPRSHRLSTWLCSDERCDMPEKRGRSPFLPQGQARTAPAPRQAVAGGPICAAPGSSGLAALVSDSRALAERSARLRARSELDRGPQDREEHGEFGAQRRTAEP